MFFLYSNFVLYTYCSQKFCLKFHLLFRNKINKNLGFAELIILGVYLCIKDRNLLLIVILDFQGIFGLFSDLYC